MNERTVSVPKILCHSDGSIFCNWRPGKLDAYAVYLSDLDTPPAPESLNITTRGYAGDLSSLVWKPVIQIVQKGEPGEVEVTGPYDAETGEGV